ncbi:Copper amine oxidase N-terminal domain-containing protein [Cohnella sp. OV330]|uniref:copper amine oxidase N-terminal domain-containing protein n=1 Tax=Cohnella sp. OV330 TaxID=1855288 RepID=UPI0008EA20B0|nr:copper amine oxidase N-terminal domain-containing protein [Cohnella sp. OV330]SFB44917.1 Copper amine oxidase N-terminal domain-containing protein [Cohnella sp. OV330]
MKKLCSSLIIAFGIILSTSPVYASNQSIVVDGIAINSDAKPEVKNNRTMVPLRIISENLGAKVEWKKTEVNITKNKMKLSLNTNDSIALKNGEKVQLDAKPYLKNNRIYVPIRFIAETFQSKVNYDKGTVRIDTAPFTIDGVAVKAFQQEFHMIMGGVVQQIRGNAYEEALYRLIEENKGKNIEEPANYAWRINLDEAGAYYKNSQNEFLDEKGNSLKRFDIYSLQSAIPAGTLSEYPEIVVHDFNENQWYEFIGSARDSLEQLINTASMNGFLTIISNTVA